jgi:hypothetical protein
MTNLVVTAEHVRRARNVGACEVPKIGTRVEELKYSQCVWAEDNSILSPNEIASLPSPLWTLASSGSGDGYGSGYGYGSGSGSGSGYGSGSGDGTERTYQ